MKLLRSLGDILFKIIIIFTLHHFVLDVSLKLYWIFMSSRWSKSTGAPELLIISINSVNQQQPLRVNGGQMLQ